MSDVYFVGNSFETALRQARHSHIYSYVQLHMYKI